MSLPAMVFSQSNKQYFPFIAGAENEITVFTESKPIYPRYKKIFEEYGYSGNGYCWEGHITQILEKINPDLLKHIRMDPEAGAFFAFADSKTNQIAFLKLLSPIFSDEKTLVSWIKKADHDRISD